MEYIEVIAKIVDAEKRARDLVDSAKEKEASLDDDIAAETEALHDKYRQRAEDKIREAEQAEMKRTETELAKLEEDYKRSLDSMEATFTSLYNIWKSKSLQIITGE